MVFFDLPLDFHINSEKYEIGKTKLCSMYKKALQNEESVSHLTKQLLAHQL